MHGGNQLHAGIETAPISVEPGRDRSFLPEQWGRALLVGTKLLAGVYLGSVAASHASCTETDLGGQPTELCTDVDITQPWQGGTEVDLGIIDTVELPDTHQGPLHFRARPEALDFENPAIRRLMDDPENLEQSLTALLGNIREDLRPGILSSIARATAAFMATNVGIWAAGPAYERLRGHTANNTLLKRRVLQGTGAGLAVTVLAAGATAATIEDKPLASAHSEGLLSQAGNLAVNIQNVTENYRQYGEQIAKKASYAYELYKTANGLPAELSRKDVVRILVQTDIHCGLASYDMLRAVATGADVDAAVDIGDTTDYGSVLERACLDPLSTYVDARGKPLPVYWIKGNHENEETASYVDSLEHVTVLDGQAANVKGLFISGMSDPRYSPSPRQDESVDSPQMKAFTEHYAQWLRVNKPQVAFVHDHKVAMNLARRNLVGSVVAGHSHERDNRLVGSTNLHVEGSAGAEGLRVLEADDDKPSTIKFSVLSFDKKTGRLVGGELFDVDAFGANPTVQVTSLPQKVLYQPPKQEETSSGGPSQLAQILAGN